MKPQENNLKTSSFPKILSLKWFGSLRGSDSGDNRVFYFSTISWPRPQQETK